MLYMNALCEWERHALCIARCETLVEHKSKKPANGTDRQHHEKSKDINQIFGCLYIILISRSSTFF